MTETNTKTAILLLSCKDSKGLVYKITNFIYKLGGNIIDLDEHVDTSGHKFFLRVAFVLENYAKTEKDIAVNFEKIANSFNAIWEINFTNKKQKCAIFVSKYDHCLQEILWRNSLNEFNIEINAIISNHNDLNSLAKLHNVPFYNYDLTDANKENVEKHQLELLSKLNIDIIVLARYMQILSPTFVNKYPNKIINIHHSFLPAFIGGNPYKQAFNRGVKIIGATSHYVTNELDEGPIIEQDIIRISHNDSLKELIRKGRDLERLVLARALLLHSQYRILVDGKKTIVF